MAVQGFFSPDRKTRMAGEKENNAAFSVKVKPVTIANNINKYNEQTPSLDYAPDRVGEYIREYDKRTEEKEERPSYTPPPPTASSYYDQTVKESEYGMPHLTGKSLDTLVESRIKDSKKYSNLDDYVRKNISYGTDKDGNPTATSTSIYNYGQPLNVSTEKLKSFMVQDAKENQYQSLVDRAERAEIAEHNKKVDAMNQLETKKIVDKFGYDPRGLIDPNAPVGTRIDEKTGLQVYPKRESIFTNDVGFDYSTLDQKTINEIKQDHNLNFDVEKGFYRKEEKQDNTVPAGAFTITPKEDPKLNRLEEAKKQPKVEETKNIFQRIGDTVGDVFNKVTGTEAFADDTLQAQGINTSATQNLRQMGYVSDDLQTARDALAKANLRKSGLDRTVGGQSSQANYGSGRDGTFGTGTHGKGLPSNPKGFSGYSRKTSPSTGGRPSGSKSTSRGTAGSRSRGGTGTGSSRSNTGSKSSARGARGSAGSTGRGGTGSGSSKSNTGSKRSARGARKCDIRCKIDISPLINSNLVKDNLAEVAYFVQEIRN